MRNEAEPLTTFYAGIARLPGRSESGEALVVELEVEPRSRRIVATEVSGGLAGMQRLVNRVLVGRCLDDVEDAVRYVRAHYHSAMQNALCTAIIRAAQIGADGQEAKGGS